MNISNNNSISTNQYPNIKSIRCQLPQDNPYYPYDLPQDKDDDGDCDCDAEAMFIEKWREEKSGENANTCIVCG